MCPFCFTTAVLVAAGVTSTSGLAAIVIGKFGVKSAADIQPAPSKEDRHG